MKFFKDPLTSVLLFQLKKKYVFALTRPVLLMVPAFDVRSQEGKQASLAADFSITQFRHLGRLLMVHGRNSYKRSAALSQFVIHRSLCISTMQVGGRAQRGPLCRVPEKQQAPFGTVTPPGQFQPATLHCPRPPSSERAPSACLEPSCVGAEAMLALQSLSGGAWPGTRWTEV